jgi:NitT/TauT family transport system substrate-binding protein
LFTSKARIGGIAAVLGSALAIAACGDSSESPTTGSSAASSGATTELTEVKYGILPVDNQAAIKLGERRGIFEKHGIKLSFGQVAPTGAAAISQLLSGQLDATGAAVTSVVTAVSQGVPVRAVSNYTENYDKDGKAQNALIVPADSGVSSFKDLEGKTVALNSLKGTWEVGLKEAVAKDGGDPSRVKIVIIPFNTQLNALKRGTVDAAAMIEPFQSQALAQGSKSLGSTDAVALGNPTGSSGAVYMTEKFIKAHPAVVKQWNAAVAEASSYGNAHPDEIREEIAEMTSAPVATLKARPLPAYSGKLVRADVQTWADLLVKYKIIDAAPPIDDVVAAGALTDAGS